MKHIRKDSARSLAIIALVMVSATVLSCGSGFNPLKQRHESTSSNSYDVGPSRYQYRAIHVSAGMSDACLKCSFTASGGMGNDIKAHVLDAENYLNWSNDHDCRTYYSSGQVTAGSFNVALPGPGTYYIVYDNRFSLLSTKRVTENLTFSYKE